MQWSTTPGDEDRKSREDDDVIDDDVSDYTDVADYDLMSAMADDCRSGSAVRRQTALALPQPQYDIASRLGTNTAEFFCRKICTKWRINL